MRQTAARNALQRPPSRCALWRSSETGGMLPRGTDRWVFCRHSTSGPQTLTRALMPVRFSRLQTADPARHLDQALNSVEGQRASDRVARYMKAAISPLSTTSASALVTLTQFSEAFASTLIGFGSVFDTVHTGAKMVPVDTRIVMISGGATASTVAELTSSLRRR